MHMHDQTEILHNEHINKQARKSSIFRFSIQVNAINIHHIHQTVLKLKYEARIWQKTCN